MPRRYLLPLFTLLPLAACGPGRDQFAPLCPAPRLIPTLADVTRYGTPGPAHDLTDMVFQARVISVSGNCQAGDDKSTVVATLNIGLSLQRGPAMSGRDADVPVFLAVTKGEDIVDKRVFPVHIVFPPNVDRLTITSPDITLNLPVNQSVTGASYGVIAGFQLSPDELAANRQSLGR